MKSQLYTGDCREVMAGFDDDCIDLTVTSPPYDNLRTYGGTLNWNTEVWQEVIRQLWRVTKKGGVVVWVVGDATIKGSETGTSFRQALYFKEVGFNLHDTMIWEKTGQGAVGSNRSYWQNFEFMFVFSKGKLSTFNPIQDRQNKFSGHCITTGGRRNNGLPTSRRQVHCKPRGRRFNTWVINQATHKQHKAVFPHKLARDHITSWSNPGDTILDPFTGSGTTGVACKELDRNFIGIELNEEYCDIARQRINETPTATIADSTD